MGREFFKHWPELLLLHFVPKRENYLVHNSEKAFKQAFNDCFTFKFEKGFFYHAHPSASSSCQDDSTSWLCFSFFGFCFFTHLITVSYTHLRAHETDSYLVCRLLLEKKKK